MTRERKRQTIAIHGAIWAVLAAVIMYFLTHTYPTGVAIARGGFLVLIYMGVFYFNTEVLIPRLLGRKRYWVYLIGVVLLFGLAGFLIHLMDALLFDEHFQFPDKFLERIHRREMRELADGREHGHGHRFRHKVMRSHIQRMIMSRVIFNGLVTLGILFVGTSWKLLKMADRRSRLEAQLREENLETEMKFLRSQVNPHFLFNALNNVYSLSVIKSEKAPDAILKLSDLLRYNLYESNDKTVDLEKELDYIRNFVELQQLKTEEEQKINLELLNSVPGQRIAPLLFIPFLENAVKHSGIEDTANGWINIRLKNSSGKLVFEVENSIPEKAFTKDETGGIGLNNVRRRLELLYPDRHVLSAMSSGDRYLVKLEIEHRES